MIIFLSSLPIYLASTMQSPVLRAFTPVISFILVTTLRGSHYYNPHFTDEEALAQRLSHLLKATQLVSGRAGV